MFGWLFGRTAPQPEPAPPSRRPGLFSTDYGPESRKRFDLRAHIDSLAQPQPIAHKDEAGNVVTMDESNSDAGSIKPSLTYGAEVISDLQIQWYANQSFIGYQLCAILAQHWLIDKACSMPGKDIVRKGYSLGVNDGTKLSPEVITYVQNIDKQMRLKFQMQEFLRKGRIFGIRVAIFKVESDDPNYYRNPFNIDGVAPNSYKGIVQVDPYWIAPELTSSNLVKPDDLHFYEPEFWRIGQNVYHRSHLVIYTTGQVADVLKPSYYYGGVSVPQKIFERVYAAERTANEAPMLAMTKRLLSLSTDMEAAMANETQFNARMEWFRSNRDNFGLNVNGEEDKLQQFDLTLTDFDGVLLTQYQLVASIADVPGTKLLGTQPKGFNSTGDYEEASYHENLETLRDNDLSPLLDRHYLLIVKSYVLPTHGIAPTIVPQWNELDAMTALEQAQVNLAKAQVGTELQASGAIEAQDERTRIVTDPDSGYNGLSPKLPPMPDAAVGAPDPVPGQPAPKPVAPPPPAPAPSGGAKVPGA